VFTRSGNSAESEPILMKSGALSEYIVWGWPWQILGAIRAVARAGAPGDFLSGKYRTTLPISGQPNFTQL